MRGLPGHAVALALGVGFAGTAVASEVPQRVESIEIRQERRGNATAFVARNLERVAPAFVELDLEPDDGLSLSERLPVRVVLGPGERREILVVSARGNSPGGSHRVQVGSGFGDPGATIDPDFVYGLPYAPGTEAWVDQGYLSPGSHRGLHALDFGLGEGSPIHAARAGVVAGVEQDEDRGGPDEALVGRANYVEVLHDDGSWASYAHLKKDGALVAVGERVERGQPIALSGSTGQALGAHLHFSVHQATWSGQRTIAAVFDLGGGRVGVPAEGEAYVASAPE